jgi:formylglycine-generating enzyme required for sulfatase activity
MLYPAGSDGYVWMAPVGSYKPNAFGLYDMHGNAWEWCSDWYAEDYYKKSPADDPKGPPQGNQKSMRGGGFDNTAAQERSALRAGAAPSMRGAVSGFRIVREK